MRTHALALASLMLACPALASAQEASTAPSVPPVMVAVIASDHVPDDVALAVQTALVDGVRPLAGGRPVLPLAMAEMRDRLAACADAPCRGALLGDAGAIGAIIAHLTRRTARGEITLTIDIVDPVSGAPRLGTLTALVPDAAGAGSAIAPLVEQLRPVMFSPPPPPTTLLVTVNVDGASVTIDDVSAGESPLASVRVTPGHHVVMVTRAGYAGTRRELDVEDGEQARLDVVLSMLEGSSLPVDASPSAAGAAAGPTPWYEEWYVWVGVGAGVLLITGIVVGAVIASQPTPQPDPMGIPLPGLHF